MRLRPRSQVWRWSVLTPQRILVLLFLAFAWRMMVASRSPTTTSLDSIDSIKPKMKMKTVFLVVTPSPESFLEALIETALGRKISMSDFLKLSETEKPILKSGGAIFGKTWKDPPDWLGYGFNISSVPVGDRREYVRQIKDQVDTHQSDVIIIHTPYLSLTGSLWLEALDTSNVTIVYGRRASVAEQTYAALDHQEMQRLSASEFRSILLSAILPAIETLHSLHKNFIVFEWANSVWTSGTLLTFPTDISESEHISLRMMYQEAIPLLSDLSMQLNRGAVIWPELVRRDDEAYVSIMTASKSLRTVDNKGQAVLASGIFGSDGNEPEYTNGVIGLGRGLSFFDATRERVLLVTNSPLHDLDTLDRASAKGGWTIRRVEPINDYWFAKCKYKPTRSHQNVRWGLMASKLRILEMTDKSALLYLDLDIAVTGQVQKLFQTVPPEYVLVSEGGIQHSYLNAGFLFVRPNKDIFDGLMRYFEATPPTNIFNNLIDCTEMGLINAYFGLPDVLAEIDGRLVMVTPPTLSEPQVNGRTARLPLDSESLSPGRPDFPRKTRLPLAYHFIRRDLCPKPWRVSCDVTATCSKDNQPCPEKGLKSCDIKAYVTWCRFFGYDKS